MIVDGGAPVGKLKDGDGFIFFNFRSDRAREITRSLHRSRLHRLPSGSWPKLSSYVCMTTYDETFDLPVAFGAAGADQHLRRGDRPRPGSPSCGSPRPRSTPTSPSSSTAGAKSPFPGEDRALIPSPKEVATYDLKPEMSAYPVTEELLKRLDEDKYDVIILNFANADMVGHTGIMEAAVRAVEAVDECVGKLVEQGAGDGGTPSSSPPTTATPR